MKSKEEAIVDIDKMLKPFQLASVNYVLQQLYHHNRNKVLIADEVGLGKTIVAKGVIAKAIDKHHKGKRPFHVVYICSNQVLAQQNISKLNPFEGYTRSISRLVFLALKPTKNKNEKIQLSSLTPSTSFNLTKSVGVKEERAILYCLLTAYSDLRNLKDTLIKLLRGGKGIINSNWLKTVEKYEFQQKDKIRKGLPKDYRNHLMAIPYDRNRFPRTNEFLNNREYNSFYNALVALIRKLEKRTDKDPLHFAYEIIMVLRKELTKVCVKYINADLFILDEFQRFKSLLDAKEESEANEISQAVLQDDEAKVLLLSATPFKPYTTQIEQLQGEDHHTDFKRIITFLGGSKGEELWNELRADQIAFFNILRHPQNAVENNEVAIETKLRLEKTFKKLISRNERMSLAENYSNMILPTRDTDLAIIKEDIKNFIGLDKVAQTLAKINPKATNRFGSIIEFSKSAPYPLSYLQGYKLREYIDRHMDSAELSNLFKKNESAWLSRETLNKYKAIGYDKGEPTYPNPKLRALAKECFKHNAELLLWVQPSKCFYEPFGAYKKAKDFSKILVFSSWAMVPRAISTLLSYEVERRTIGAELISELKEKENRQYFDSKPKPRPILTYSSIEGKMSNMSNLILMYPFQFKGINVLNDSKFCFGKSFSTIKTLQVEKLKQVFKEFKIQKKYCKRNSIDDKWYWLAPILIDYLNTDKSFSVIDRGVQKFKGSKGDHFKFAQKTLINLEEGKIELGEFPKDLFEILAITILASPANATLFALRNLFVEINDYEDFEDESLQIAEAFRSYLNKPESISAIRLASNEKDYWRQVLDYCASGNITSMMAEYMYLVKENENFTKLSGIVEYLENILTTRPSNIQVDMRNESGEIETNNMRCYFAISYGTQKLNSDSGKDRAVNVRTVFNSPFRPFVLTSTSIGQEGLDFHHYCRKIFHWNLPHNAIDLEQREGRINRFKSLVIRKKLAEIIKDEALYNAPKDESLWEVIFNEAENIFKEDKTGIRPYWFIDDGETAIERFVPMTLFSKDLQKFDELKATLGFYRLTFGQPRQEELVEALKSSELSDKELGDLRNNLLINLSPFNS